MPAPIKFESPQQKTKYMIFISCIVPYATNFFKSVWPHILSEPSSTPIKQIVTKIVVFMLKFAIVVNL
jgi:hypothetical protein